jgi:hypothetical protein
LYLRALTNGKVSDSNTLDTIRGNIVVLISTNNTNAATVTIQRDNELGKKILDVSTVQSGMFPYTYTIDTEGSKKVFYSVSGTGASAQFFEYVA